MYLHVHVKSSNTTGPVQITIQLMKEMICVCIFKKLVRERAVLTDGRVQGSQATGIFPTARETLATVMVLVYAYIDYGSGQGVILDIHRWLARNNKATAGIS